MKQKVSLSVTLELSSQTQSVNFLTTVDISQLTSAMTHCVCAAAPPPLEERPSFMLSYNCRLFSLDGRPGLFHFLLTNLSLPSLWAPLSSLLLIWQLCLKSGYFYCCLNLVLEHSVARCAMMWPWAHILDLLSGRSRVFFPLASLTEDLPVPASALGTARGGQEGWGWHKKRRSSSDTHSWDWPLVKGIWGIMVARSQPQGGVDLSPWDAFSSFGYSWLLASWVEGLPNDLGPRLHLTQLGRRGCMPFH